MTYKAQMAEIRVSSDGSTVEIAGIGSLDFTNSQQFRDGLKQAAESADNVVVDLRSAAFIDTAILEYLARGGKALMQRGKRLKVVVLEESHPLRVLQVSNFDELIEIQVEHTTA